MGAAGPQGPPEARLPLAPPGFTALAQHKADKQLRGLAERPRGGAAGLSRPRAARVTRGARRARGKFWGRARLDGIRSLWAPEPWEGLFAPRVSAWVVSGRCAWWLPRASTWGLQKDPRSHSRPRRAETRAPTRAGQDGRLLTPPHSTLFSFPRWPQSRAVQAETQHVHRAPVCAHNVTATGTSRFRGSVPAPSPAHARPEPC